jgi:ABC-type multidrug transport system ATPase subunit
MVASPPPPGSELRVSRVAKVLGGARVLRSVDAVFAPGRVHVLEGANGSGKSTLLSLLGGRSAPTSGRIALVRADAVVAEGAALRAHVGWLGHELGLYPDLQAAENVALHASLRGIDGRIAWAHAESLGIAALADRKVRDLSRGQRQRVALVRALVGDPPVVLLDEPSTGLDIHGRERLVESIQALVARSVIVVVVTHDLPFRDALAPQVWSLAGGSLRSLGAAEIPSGPAARA